MVVIVKITRKYRVTIPKEIREKLGLRVGDKLVSRLEDDHIVLSLLLNGRRIQ